MTTASEYRALADRVDAGERGDITDRNIAEAVGWRWHGGHAMYWTDPAGRMVGNVPEWSRSLDATEALRAEKLPGWRWDDIRELRNSRGWIAALVRHGRGTRCSGLTSTEPAARLAAVLRAWAAQQETDR